MSGRVAKFVPAIFVNILAGLLLATVARGEPATAEGCLSSPWGDAPAGSQWRYHIDHANKSKCWYLRRAGEGQSQASPQNSSPAPQISAPAQPAKPSVADAHAELRRPHPAREDNPAPGASANPANTGINVASPASASVWNATEAVATRWPDPAAARPTPGAAPATTAAANDAPQPSADPSQAILPTIPFTHLTVPMQPGTIAGLIAAAIVAVAFAMLFTRRRRTRRVRRRVVRSVHGPLSETTDDDRIVVSDQFHPDGRGYRFARGIPSVAARRAREIARRPPRHASR